MANDEAMRLRASSLNIDNHLPEPTPAEEWVEAEGVVAQEAEEREEAREAEEREEAQILLRLQTEMREAAAREAEVTAFNARAVAGPWVIELVGGVVERVHGVMERVLIAAQTKVQAQAQMEARGAEARGAEEREMEAKERQMEAREKQMEGEEKEVANDGGGDGDGGGGGVADVAPLSVAIAPLSVDIAPLSVDGVPLSIWPKSDGVPNIPLPSHITTHSNTIDTTIGTTIGTTIDTTIDTAVEESADITALAIAEMGTTDPLSPMHPLGVSLKVLQVCWCSHVPTTLPLRYTTLHSHSTSPVGYLALSHPTSLPTL